MANWTIHRDTVTTSLPPWFSLQNITVERAAVVKKKEAYSQEQLFDLAMEKIRSVDCAVHIYTDGSTSTNQEGGGAGVYAEDDEGNVLLRESFPAGAYSSSYSAEAVAMLQAVQWVEETAPRSCLICTDSMSLVDAIEKNNWKDPDECLKKIKTTISRLTTQITLLWIPSHCGIRGNEEADDLAKHGSDMAQDNVPVSHKSVKARIKARKWDLEHPRARELYGARRSVRLDVEKAWPRKVRALYGRLRTEHAMELGYYQYKMDKVPEKEAYCRDCGDEYETTRHILCSCPALAVERQRQFEGGTPRYSDLVLKPEQCRILLSKRFEDLTIKHTVRSPQT
jgi:ribonuclease HI